MELITIKLSDYKPHPQNPNTHPDHQLDELGDSLGQFGQFKNVVVWNGYYLAGHGLVEAASRKGLTTLEAVDVSHLPEEKAKSLMVADNRLPELAIMDDEMLTNLLKEFDDALNIPGIDLDFINTLDFGDGIVGNIDQDEVPQVEKPITKPGDLWVLGEHRLLCGDATKKEDMGKLLMGKKINMVFTDPPYGVNYAAKNKF